MANQADVIRSAYANAAIESDAVLRPESMALSTVVLEDNVKKLLDDEMHYRLMGDLEAKKDNTDTAKKLADIAERQTAHFELTNQTFSKIKSERDDDVKYILGAIDSNNDMLYELENRTIKRLDVLDRVTADHGFNIEGLMQGIHDLEMENKHQETEIKWMKVFWGVLILIELIAQVLQYFGLF